MKRFEPIVLAMLVCLAAFTVACGGSTPSSEPAAPAAAPAEPAPAPPPEAPAPAMTAPTTDDEYGFTEQSIADHNRTLREHLEAKTAAGVAQEARQLEQLFTGVETFWTGRKIDDAIGFAKSAKASAQAIAAAADANDLAAAGKAMQTLTATCDSCHKAHRQQDGDYFSIK